MVPRMPATLVAQLETAYRVLGPLEASRPEHLPREAGDVVALLTIGTQTTSAALIDALPALKLIACYGTGHEGVDRAHAAARGIVVVNAGDANAASVAEFALGLVLASVRQIAVADRFVRAGSWAGTAVERMPTIPSLAGRRLGIYGLGAVGTRIAAMAKAFDVTIGYHNRNRRADVDYAYHDTLEDLADWADVLVVAVRASAENRHAVDASVLDALGPQGHLVNIARGAVVDTEALCDALERRTIAGAALDVFETEPHVPERLKTLPNVILTPHVAANTEAARAAQDAMMLANLAAFFAGRPVPGPVV